MATRIQPTAGKCFKNNGVRKEYKRNGFELDYEREFYVFDAVPIGKPRMTQSDKWKTNPNHPDPKKRKRPAVHKYHEWQNSVRPQAEKMGYVLEDTIEMYVFLPMPDSWSKKKKAEHNGKVCCQKPDWDNVGKAWCDTFAKEDKEIWYGHVEQRWAYAGSIIVYK